MRKIAKISNFFAPQGNPLPDVNEIRKVYAGNRCTKAVSIWCDSVSKLESYKQKTVTGHFPEKFSESLSSETTGRIEKIKRAGAKMVIFMQSLVEIRCCTAA